jgi:hypothetical protein
VCKDMTILVGQTVNMSGLAILLLQIFRNKDFKVKISLLGHINT